VPTETNTDATPRDQSVSDPAGEGAHLREQLRTEHEMYLRALADFDNYRRRVERESARIARSGKRDIMLSILEVMDGFDRAFQHAEKNQSALWEGVQAIHRQLLAALQAQGIAPFDSVGHAFDPALHEAIATVPSNGHPSGTVVDDVRRGYRWGDEVLRPARVRVAQ
jgi:molecular chaperone GrpE